MGELAWLWLRYQPESALAKWFRERLGGAKGRMKKVLIVGAPGDRQGVGGESPSR
jgi:hypothetical protein